MDEIGKMESLRRQVIVKPFFSSNSFPLNVSLSLACLRDRRWVEGVRELQRELLPDAAVRPHLEHLPQDFFVVGLGRCLGIMTSSPSSTASPGLETQRPPQVLGSGDPTLLRRAASGQRHH